MFSTRNGLGRNVKINTEGCCFFCLKQVSPSKRVDFNDGSSGDLSMISDLIHYLNLNVDDFIDESNSTSKENNFRGRSSVAVELCEKCVKLSERISKLISVKRTVEMEISYRLGFIHQKIFESGRTPSKMKHYYRVMKMFDGDPGSNFFRKVDSLRKQLSNKCTKATSMFQPKVRIRRIRLDSERLSDLRSAKEDCGIAVITSLDSIPIADRCILKTEIEINDGNTDNDDPLASGSPERECFSEQEIDNDPLASVSPKNESSSEPEIENDPLASVYPEKESSSEPEIDNNAESSLKCTVCGGTFADRPTLNTHMRKVHGKKKLKCPHCSRLFPPISKLYKGHIQKCSISSVHQRGRKTTSEPCQLCSKVYSTKYTLALHYRRAHPHVNHQTNINVKEHKCDICSKIFFSQTNLSNHKSSAHFGARHNCKFPGCVKKYFSQEALVLHWRRKHGALHRPRKKY